MKTLKCTKCDTEMILAELIGGMYPVLLRNKRRRLLDTELRLEVSCYVCPECGYIELYAKEANRLRHI